MAASLEGGKKTQLKSSSSWLLSWYFDILEEKFHISVDLSFKTSVKGISSSSLKPALKQQLMGMLNIKILLWETDLHSKANHTVI